MLPTVATAYAHSVWCTQIELSCTLIYDMYNNHCMGTWASHLENVIWLVASYHCRHDMLEDESHYDNYVIAGLALCTRIVW